MKKHLPLLIQPKYQSLLNSMSHRKANAHDRGRIIVVIIFSAFVFLAILKTTLWSLEKLSSNIALGTLPSYQPLAVAFMLLFLMLVTSNIAAALAFLYLGKDIEMLVTAPISRLTLFSNKLFHICLFSSWMPFLFLFPFLIGFGITYHAGLLYYATIALVLIPFFIIPTSIGITVATLVSLILPSRRSRIARVLMIGVIIFTGVSLLFLARTVFISMQSSSEIGKVLELLTAPSTMWSPSRWCASILDSLLHPTQYSVLPDWILLYSTTIWISAVAYVSVECFFDRAFSNTCTQPASPEKSGSISTKILMFLVAPFSPRVQALILKEARSVTRDISHLFEVIMIGSLSCMYLYNLRFFSVIDNVPPNLRENWTSTLFLINIATNSFVITALCTRFVFPSISREGAAFWMLSSSPVSYGDILRAKLWGWMIPVCSIGTGFLVISAILMKLSYGIILMSAFFSLFVCYSIVASALGIGAIFAATDAEHPSHVSGGFGSFFFMLYACFLIFANMLPAWYLLLIKDYHDERLSNPWEFLILISISLGIITINIASSRYSLARGEKALIETTR